MSCIALQLVPLLPIPPHLQNLIAEPLPRAQGPCYGNTVDQLQGKFISTQRAVLRGSGLLLCSTDSKGCSALLGVA